MRLGAGLLALAVTKHRNETTPGRGTLGILG
jgi:hypothetical protein